MNLQHTPATVLAVSTHGEADKIVTFYGRSTGKRKGIAKGAQRSRIRFVNKLEIFSQLEISYEESRRSSLVRIDQAELLDPFAALRGDYLAYTAASLVVELLREWTEEGDADPRVFSLLNWALRGLAADGGRDQGRARSREENIVAAIIFFELKLLELLGYRPTLAGCQLCGNPPPDQRSCHFSLTAGGLICRHCNRENRSNLVPLSLATAKIMAKAQDLGTDKLARLRLPPSNGQEALHFLHRYSRHLLQREIHSRRSLQNLLARR